MIKDQLRKQFLKARECISSAEYSELNARLVANLKNFLKKHKKNEIFIFSSIRNEPNLFELQNHFSLFLPRMTARKTLEFFTFENAASLIKNRFGILEPDPTRCEKKVLNEHSALCIPCVALDRQGIRLGFGGGFYDRLLQAQPQIFSIAILFSSFIVEELPHDHWDQRLSAFCTELGSGLLPL